MAETPPITTSSPTASPEPDDLAEIDQGLKELNRQQLGRTPPRANSPASTQDTPQNTHQDTHSSPQQPPTIQTTQQPGNVQAGSRDGPWPEMAPSAAVRSAAIEMNRKRWSKPATQSSVKNDSVSLLPETPKPIADNDLQQKAGITGLAAIPKGWPDLPSNASLMQEIAWVQSERLRVVKDGPGSVIRVDLSKARVPAPSMSALSWLETSIRSYAKFVEVASKQASSGQDEAEFVRKERMSIGEIRSILSEMLPPAG